MKTWWRLLGACLVASAIAAFFMSIKPGVFERLGIVPLYTVGDWTGAILALGFALFIVVIWTWILIAEMPGLLIDYAKWWKRLLTVELPKWVKRFFPRSNLPEDAVEDESDEGEFIIRAFVFLLSTNFFNLSGSISKSSFSSSFKKTGFAFTKLIAGM